MTFTSIRPVYVDGVRLDTLAWNILKINRATSSRRTMDQTLPGVDGNLPSLNDDLEPQNYGLEMLVRGTDADGGIPAAGSWDTFRSNLDELVHLFGKRHGLLEVMEQTSGLGTLATNYANPVEATPGWVQNAGATISVDPNLALFGTRSMKVTTTAANWGYWNGAGSLMPGMTYTASIYVFSATAQTLTLINYGANGTNGPGVAVPANTWTRLSVTFVAGSTVFLSVRSSPNVNTVIGDVNLDGFLVTDGDQVLPYFDGDTAADSTYSYSYQGTAGASASRRVPVSMRRAWAKVVDSIAPDVNAIGSAGTFTVGLVLPYGVWEDVDPQDWVSAAPTTGVPQDVATMTGATERTQDGVLLVQGPAATGLRVTDVNTGAYVSLARALSATEQWRVNMATWSSRYGTGLTLGSADTAGTDAQALTTFGGIRNQASFLPLTPARVASSRRVQLALTAGGITSATRFSVRARRKFGA